MRIDSGLVHQVVGIKGEVAEVGALARIEHARVAPVAVAGKGLDGITVAIGSKGDGELEASAFEDDDAWRQALVQLNFKFDGVLVAFKDEDVARLVFGVAGVDVHQRITGGCSQNVAVFIDEAQGDGCHGESLERSCLCKSMGWRMLAEG